MSKIQQMNESAIKAWEYQNKVSQIARDIIESVGVVHVCQYLYTLDKDKLNKAIYDYSQHTPVRGGYRTLMPKVVSPKKIIFEDTETKVEYVDDPKFLPYDTLMKVASLLEEMGLVE